jgi:hypothetical protein
MADEYKELAKILNSPSFKKGIQDAIEKPSPIFKYLKEAHPEQQVGTYIGARQPMHDGTKTVQVMNGDEVIALLDYATGFKVRDGVLFVQSRHNGNSTVEVFAEGTWTRSVCKQLASSNEEEAREKADMRMRIEANKRLANAAKIKRPLR